MTRKTFQTLVVGIALSAAAVSPNASAYFAVSLPGSAITMSGTQYGPPVPAEATPAAPPRDQTRQETRTVEARQVKRSLLRALFLPGF